MLCRRLRSPSCLHSCALPQSLPAAGEHGCNPCLPQPLLAPPGGLLSQAFGHLLQDRKSPQDQLNVTHVPWFTNYTVFWRLVSRVPLYQRVLLAPFPGPGPTVLQLGMSLCCQPLSV